MKKDKKQRQFDVIVPGSPMASDIRNTDLGYGIRNWKKQLKESDKINILFEKNSFKKKSEQRKEQLDLARFIESKKKR